MTQATHESITATPTYEGRHIVPADDLRLARTLAEGDPLRQRLEGAIGRLEALARAIIANLDLLEDPDLEPSLGGWQGATDDREGDDDAEPSLGSVDAPNQRGWGAGSTLDHEWEHDGREPDVEGAPVSWADVPEKTRAIMRRLALAVHEADLIKLEAN